MGHVFFWVCALFISGNIGCYVIMLMTTVILNSFTPQSGEKILFGNPNIKIQREVIGFSGMSV